MSLITHGESNKAKNTKEYGTWCRMKSRCYLETNTKYPSHGGRGIIVCERWLHSYENFLADMGRAPSSEHSLDRFPNNDGNYEPSNCRWATPKQQSNNRRSSIPFTINDKTMTLPEWCELFGVSYETIRRRVQRGWTAEKALITPLFDRGQNN